MTTTLPDIDLAKILQRIRANGLNNTAAEVLDEICRRGEGSLTNLSTITGLTTAAMTATADKLEALGFAKRKPVPGDRRTWNLQVTRKGITTLESILS